jgi:elongation factor Ts
MKEMIKKLREITGAGMLDCQKALKESAGDFEKAKEMLVSKLGDKAVKKEGRETNEGVIGFYMHSNKKMSAMVSLKCETDFVAKNEMFVKLANDIAMHIGAADPADIDELLVQPFIKDANVTIHQLINQAIGKIGENIVIFDFKRFRI